MPALFFKLIPLFVSCVLLVFAFRMHERFWSLGFSGWKKIYFGLAAIFLGSLGGIFFEFAELREWQMAMGWPVDWAILSILTSLGAGLLLWGSVERLSLAAREKESLDERREAFELFDSIRDAAQGPYSFLEILNFSLKEIIRKIDADAGGIWLTHPSGKDYILASASGFALPLQQRLERVPTIHAGFGRIVEGGSAREVYNPESLQNWFPELCGRVDNYGSLIGIPLFGGSGSSQRRDTLGILLLCSRGRASLGPSDIKLIGSAVAFLASTIAEVKTARQLRNQKSAYERLRRRENELSDWIKVWSDKIEPRRRLQSAVAALADQVGDFVGCGLYVVDGNRWEPLAMAGASNGQDLLGNGGFRGAAIKALHKGVAVEYELATEQGVPGDAVGYRMVPCGDPQSPGTFAAVLFVPIIPNQPGWFNAAIEILAELTQVVLATDKPSVQKISIPLPQPKPRPDYNWAGLGHLIQRCLRKKPEYLPTLLTELLPQGWRMGIWQAVSFRPARYHLRLAAGRKVKSLYQSRKELALSLPADEMEFNAYLGGLVRLAYRTGLWPDFGEGWRGERFPVIHQPKNWGWITFYQKADAEDAKDETLNYLQALAGTVEIILARHDRPAAASASRELSPSASGDAGDNGDTTGAQDIHNLRELPSGRVSLDRAIAQWIVTQTDGVRLGRFAFDSAPEATPLMPARILHDILSWGAGHLKNGLPASECLTINARGENGRISIVFERSDPLDENSEQGSLQPVSIAPVSDDIRAALDARNARVRVINAPNGPRKLMLSFDATENEAVSDKGAGKVLIIDEQEFLRDLLLGMLEILNRSAVAAASAEEGLQLFAAGEYDVVVSGETLSGMTAPELAQEIKQQNDQVRFVIVQELGYPDSSLIESEWVDHILPKPFRIEDLRVALTASPAVGLSGSTQE